MSKKEIYKKWEKQLEQKEKDKQLKTVECDRCGNRIPINPSNDHLAK